MARVEEIRRDNTRVAELLPADGEEIGLRLSRRSKLADIIAVVPHVAATSVLQNVTIPDAGKDEMDPVAGLELRIDQALLGDQNSE